MTLQAHALVQGPNNNTTKMIAVVIAVSFVYFEQANGKTLKLELEKKTCTQ